MQRKSICKPSWVPRVFIALFFAVAVAANASPAAPTIFTVTRFGDTLANGTNPGDGLGTGASGDLRFELLAGKVYKIAPGGAKTTAASSINGSSIVAVDAAGDLYVVAEDENGEIVEVTPAGVQTVFNTPSIVYVGGVAISGAGNLYVPDGDTGYLYEIVQATGASLSFATTAKGSTNPTPQTVTVQDIGNAES